MIKSIIFNFLLSILLFFTATSEAMLSNGSSVPSVVGSEKFKEIIKYAYGFLLVNQHRLSAQKNESGFVRFNIPLDSSVHITDGTAKIRLNYWSSKSNLVIKPETIHTHPYCFESMIISGGYTQSIWDYSKQKDAAFYDLYRIFKNGNTKSFSFLTQSKLKEIAQETTRAGDIVVFDREFIHRVESTLPDTLTLNVVSQNLDELDSCYDVFLSRSAVLGDIKTDRDFFMPKESRFFITEILDKLKSV